MIYSIRKALNYSLSFLSKVILPTLFILLIGDIKKIRAQDSEKPSYSCTQVIGFSQVGQTGSKDQPGPGYGWYIAGGVFESAVDDNRWQLLWKSGGSVDQWANPEYDGWDQRIVSPCKNNDDSPDRVLFSISGLYGKDIKGWSTAIEKAVNTIQHKLPTAEIIILQPVVGGPNGDTCPCTRNCNFENSPFKKTFKEVRASWQHSYIGKAIEQIIASPMKEITVKGYFPQVGSCSHYIDGLGHLTKEGGKYVGEKLGNDYK
ncbi:hypothetical protein [Fodinibius saliphilus]|uniref:hypothetical protein n=1 Tax=Fodinibius saliphilus TaxID=1920650 RepID=UPI001107E8AE|nr:hypothetical protein [Fodinibius saliphilus]